MAILQVRYISEKRNHKNILKEILKIGEVVNHTIKHLSIKVSCLVDFINLEMHFLSVKCYCCFKSKHVVDKHEYQVKMISN